MGKGTTYVDVAWEEPEDREEEVYAEVGAAARDHQDADGWQEEGYEDEEDCRDHCCGSRLFRRLLYV